jgi:hypothetical protein
MFSPETEALRLRLVTPWRFRLYLLRKLPLALAAGLRLVRLDQQQCAVALPGGWRTRNPFGSAYFAAQAMAAELSTGAPAMLLAGGASASVALILVELRAVFSRRILDSCEFVFADVAGMKAAVDGACRTTEPVRYEARSTARSSDGSVLSAFELSWSFKQRAPRP